MSTNELDLHNYDNYIVAFSGGKDSLACLLYLLDCGIPKSKIELWHHDIDGREGSKMMDWACTASYCKAVADALDIPIYYSWKEGGFEREMLRKDTLTAPICWEEPQADGTVVVKRKGGTRGKPSTREKFPQVSADLRVRWCSAYLKIDVCRRVLANDPRFVKTRTLVITGERAEESSSRAKYNEFEAHASDLRDGKKARHIDAWRPVHSWKEQRVWDIIEKHGIKPHPAYIAGWGRVSCAACIFGSNDQWASLAEIAPKMVEVVADYEQSFGVTIKRNQTVRDSVEQGTSYDVLKTDAGTLAACEATTTNYESEVIQSAEQWELPAGAFGESCGPT